MQYRRDDTEGATYFFTVVVFRREPLLADPEKVDTLREAVRTERQRRPFQIDAMVILPDHLHALWTLPPDDADYSIRWRNIKRAFTAQIPDDQRPPCSAVGNVKGNRRFGNGGFGNIGFVMRPISPIM